jgi:hypothetical protein
MQFTSVRRFMGHRSPVIVVMPKWSPKMRLKMIAKLFVVSIVILTGSPALAAQIARHDAHCRSCEQNAGACRHRTFGACVMRVSDAPRRDGAHATHDWPAVMILE